MKTIAVLTDFSERATNAARYSLQLARRLKANILLYNTFLVPSVEPLGAQVAWPMEDYDEIKKESEKQLNQLATQLNADLDSLPSTAFRPAIQYRCTEEAFSLQPADMITDKEVVLLVLANHHHGFDAMIMGNHLQQVLDNATLPVLIVPEHTVFEKLEKITFATDLNRADLGIINSLAGLAKPFNAELMLAHICPEKTEAQKQVDDFLHEVTNHVNYPHIYYRNVCEKKITRGLQQLEETTGSDMLVMVHRSKSLLDQVFNNSFTRRVAANNYIPLLVYPHPAQRLPVF